MDTTDNAAFVTAFDIMATDPESPIYGCVEINPHEFSRIVFEAVLLNPARYDGHDPLEFADPYCTLPNLASLKRQMLAVPKENLTTVARCSICGKTFRYEYAGGRKREYCDGCREMLGRPMPRHREEALSA